ncbi:hypothetical protein ACQP04_19610 [Pseudonocardia halophobica]|uniref:hypothetical protein n=1 Tax=Pseudonocardia halophobica TaxID=29401 RepID=UPI003D8FA0F5
MRQVVDLPEDLAVMPPGPELADGTVTITAVGLPADQAQAAIDRVDRLALAIRRAGHPSPVPTCAPTSFSACSTAPCITSPETRSSGSSSPAPRLRWMAPPPVTRRQQCWQREPRKRPRPWRQMRG